MMSRQIYLFAALAMVMAINVPPTGASEVADAGGTAFVRLQQEQYSQVKANLQPGLVLDYGSFVWVELNADDYARLVYTGVDFEEQHDAFTLHLGGESFDPLWVMPDLPNGWDAVRVDVPDMHLIQFAGPTRAEWLNDLESQGLRIVKYIHPYTYIVWGELGQRSAVAEHGPVRWTGPFAPAYRVLPQWRRLKDTPGEFKVLMYRGADTEAVLESLEALGGKITGTKILNQTFQISGLAISGALLQAAAQIPGVYSIQPVPTDGGLRGEMSDQISANNVDGSNQAFPGYYSWLSNVGVMGNGVIIANVDGGIQESHPDLVNRMIGCSGQTCGGSSSSSHGTHTAGIMAADGASGVQDSFGFLRGLGQAPRASLVEQVYSPWFTQPGGMLLLMTDSYNNGASLSGNSWGPSGSPHGYDNDTLQVDIGVRDADPNTAGNQPLSFVLSFMNGNGGTSSQGTPDEAKNIFNIGSTKMQNSNGTQILQIDDLSANTAHGPALDGRTIPHMVAPGCNVDSCTSGSGYTLMCGTSMASPHVSGAVALFIEYYRNLPDFVADPSPALIKAAFLPVSHDLAGHADADGFTLGHPFDSKQGWGRMNLEAVIDPVSSVRYIDNPVTFNNTGEIWEMSFSPMLPNEPMRLMLVWTDAPGHGLGGATPAWNNDLDLVVQVGGDTYYGNNFGGDGWSVSGGSADFRNNTEGVFLGPLPPGLATIRVVASDINSDGIPNHGDTTDQDFALVCYNCALEPGFLLSATPSEMVLCAPDDALYGIDVGQIMDYTEPVTLSSSGQPAGATVDFSTNPVVPPGTSNMTITGTGAASPGFYSILIEGTAPELTRDTTVGLSLYNSIPSMPGLVTPADGAVDVSLRPAFSWTAATQAATYELEVASDAGFLNILWTENDLADTSYDLELLLAPANTYYWRVRADNVCGAGGDSAVFSFTTRETLPLLLVDDDDNTPNVQSVYTAALDALGQEYDVWDTNNSDNEPDAATLQEYAAVVWFTGDEFGGSSGPGSSGESALSAYLDNGGCLFISSQDYYWDRGLTSLMSNYLGVSSATSDVNQSSVTGAGSVFGGLGSFSLSYPFSNYSDTINPNASAELAFSGSAGNAAVNKEDSGYRTTYWGFPWEAVSGAGNRETLMSVVLDWCTTSLDCNNNGVPDTQDIFSGTSEDCNGNQVPDECDIDDGTSSDCNDNGVPDECELVDNDCNDNDTPDECDVLGNSPDDNGNGIPDECEIGMPLLVAEGSRYLAVTPQALDPDLPMALLVTGDPDNLEVSCISHYVQIAGTLGEAPVNQPASVWGTVHLHDDMIIPGMTYYVQGEITGGLLSDAAAATTWNWGDVDNSSSVNFIDILLVVRGFQGDYSIASVEATDLEPCEPNGETNFSDILMAVQAFQGSSYSESTGCPLLCE